MMAVVRLRKLHEECVLGLHRLRAVFACLEGLGVRDCIDVLSGTPNSIKVPVKL